MKRFHCILINLLGATCTALLYITYKPCVIVWEDHVIQYMKLVDLFTVTTISPPHHMTGIVLRSLKINTFTHR